MAVSTSGRRRPKSSIRKRKLPDKEQIEYFRIGHSSIINGNEFRVECTILIPIQTLFNTPIHIYVVLANRIN